MALEPQHRVRSHERRNNRVGRDFLHRLETIVVLFSSIGPIAPQGPTAKRGRAMQQPERHHAPTLMPAGRDLRCPSQPRPQPSRDVSGDYSRICRDYGAARLLLAALGRRHGPLD
jgi:hypothetical protein